MPHANSATPASRPHSLAPNRSESSNSLPLPFRFQNSEREQARFPPVQPKYIARSHPPRSTTIHLRPTRPPNPPRSHFLSPSRQSPPTAQELSAKRTVRS